MGLFRSNPRARRSLADQEKTKVVSSYYAKRGLGKSNLGRKQPTETLGNQQKPRRQKVLRTLILALIVSLVGYSLLLDPSPRLRLVQSENVAHQSVEDYQEGIASIWRQELGNRLKLTVNAGQIKQSILDKYPELADVEVHLPIAGKKPSIVLVPDTVALQIINSQGRFYTNDHGKVLAASSDISSLTNPGAIPAVVDRSGLELAPGTYVLSQSNVETIQILIASLQQANHEVTDLVLPQVINELDISLANKPYIVRFSLLEDPEQGVGAFLAFLETLKGQEQPQEYVDLRVPEKAFYK